MTYINRFVPAKHAPLSPVQVVFEAVMFRLAEAVHFVRGKPGGKLQELVGQLQPSKTGVKPEKKFTKKKKN